MSRYFCRLCFNTAYWEHPTGDAARLEGNTHCGQYGFAFEEFNFDRRMRFKGKQYGWIEGFFTDLRSGDAKPGRRPVPYGEHDVIFYTLGQDSRYFVGRIQRCEHIPQEERPHIYTPEVIHQLVESANDAGANIRQTGTNLYTYYPTHQNSDWPAQRFSMTPNIRFDPENLVLWYNDQLNAPIDYNRYGPLLVDRTPSYEDLWNTIIHNHE
jgi:hypothetical protein